MAYGTNKPFGLKPVASLLGGGEVENTNTYNILTSADGVTTYARNIFPGDAVCFNNASPGYIGTITDIAAGFPIGVFAGCEYTNTSNVFTESSYWPASTQVKAGTPIFAKVYDDPFLIYEIELSSYADVAGNARFAQTMIGKNGNINVGGALGNPASGLVNGNVSAYYLDGGAIATTSTNMLKILGLSTNAQNYLTDPTTGVVRQFLNLRVIFNVHAYKSVGTTGI